MQLGMIGLGRMGANMVRRLQRGGHECVGYDVDPERRRRPSPARARRARPTLDDLVAALQPPRTSGSWSRRRSSTPRSPRWRRSSSAATRSSTAATPGTATTSTAPRRSAEHGIDYVDVGTSGGIHGLERGYCLMIGGDDARRRAPGADLRHAGARASTPPTRTPGREGDAARRPSGAGCTAARTAPGTS